jgi:hypothetical protein
VRQRPKPPTYESSLAGIAVAPSAADLAALRQAAQNYFAGAQREDLEAAVAKRQSELPDGESLGG